MWDLPECYSVCVCVVCKVKDLLVEPHKKCGQNACVSELLTATSIYMGHTYRACVREIYDHFVVVTDFAENSPNIDAVHTIILSMPQ